MRYYPHKTVFSNKIGIGFAKIDYVFELEERTSTHFMEDNKCIAQIDSDGTNETIRYQYDNHLGSSSIELDENANIISYEEYHPFGTTSYRSGRTETEVSLKRYKYTGKERDEETGLYYYGARYYASWICRFVSVDPEAEQRIWLAPYNYVQNNPIMRIDPDGRLDDEWEVNKKGEVVNRIVNEEKDAVYVVDDNGKRIEGAAIEFEYGTITDEKHPTNLVDSERKPVPITIFEVKGDTKATGLFEFMAKNTTVEWTHAKIGTVDSEKNIVGSSHEKSSTPIGHYLRLTGYTLKEVNHNHPGGTASPSWDQSKRFDDATGDVPNAKLYEKQFPKIKLNIYTIQNGYSPYDSHGTLDDRILEGLIR